MTQATRVRHVEPSVAGVAHDAARRFAGLLASTTAELHIAVSGGSVATKVLPAFVAAVDSAGLDWTRVHVWFADERFVPTGHDDRNVVAVAEALKGAKGFEQSRLHATLASDSGESLDDAAVAYEAELRALVPPADGVLGGVPSLDLVLLGAGGDGHTASLFPGRPGLETAPALVESVRDSPKPPPERLTLTLPAIRGAARVWAVVTGAEKADAVRLAATEGVTAEESPLGAATGRVETLLLLDAAAAEALG
ncbi:6-phosphogluconolactonase [Pseudoclavibacter sp. AY1F1]|uniref:6-phosphogluconolactonase n=1 Tax=Pseudoclavibacter sp. AY1F1 TaxID=2080583 RepID=UPI000CE76E65|nr:6-phosphogluconolactonase [Pseudoclavibacter sp. AY1F1]PPF47406.1 6-phosphogluconolactonase [Pseudoclavibacter sp. AY1F1]